MLNLIFAVLFKITANNNMAGTKFVAEHDSCISDGASKEIFQRAINSTDEGQLSPSSELHLNTNYVNT